MIYCGKGEKGPNFLGNSDVVMGGLSFRVFRPARKIPDVNRKDEQILDQ